MAGCGIRDPKAVSESVLKGEKNMGMQKKMFASLKYIVPSEMEYFLEEMSRDGKILRPVGESGLFYYEFTEEKAQKARFVVDCSTMPKALYMQMAIDKGWEYLGKSFNCYIWRQSYEEQKRPESFADQSAVQKHCLRQGIVMAIVALVCLALAVAIVYFLRAERQQGMTEHTIQYAFMLASQIPFILYFAWAARKLLFEAARLKEVIARGPVRRSAPTTAAK